MIVKEYRSLNILSSLCIIFLFGLGLITILATGGGGGGGGGEPAQSSPNRSPTVNQGISNQLATIDESLSLTLPGDAFADLDAGDALTLSVSGLPSGLTFDGVDTIGGTPGSQNIGNYTITVTATDPSSASVSTTFQLYVTRSDAWIAGEFLPAFNFETQCASPRTGFWPGTDVPYNDAVGTTVDENNWLRSWSNDLYLWYDEIIDSDPLDFTTLEYFESLRTFATTPSGNDKDKYHYAVDTAEFEEAMQSGLSIGYGAVFSIIRGAPPREVVVAYTESNSPATSDPANLTRGAKLIEIDGVDVIYGEDTDTLNAGTFPSEPGESHDFVVQDLGSSTTRSFTMVSEEVTSVPVQHVGTIDTVSGVVGYMLFNDHISTAEELLIDAIDEMNAANIADLVLDLRYNSGGWLGIASELAYMIAGPIPTAGQTFKMLQYNDKHTEFHPLTGQPITPLPFSDTTLGYSVIPGLALPSLDLSRVYILTGPNTCSASESIINSLRGIDIEVIQIGSTTCGKPYGFYSADNCGTTYLSINFRGVNAKGFGDYTDGFSPINTDPIEGTEVPGCSVADDFTHGFGDPDEGRLAAALAYRVDGSCPESSGSLTRRITSIGQDLSSVDGKVNKPPWLENQMIRRNSP